MKYLQALFISLVIACSSYTPSVMAYVEFMVPSALKWQSTIERESGFETFGLYMDPSVTFGYFLPELNINPDQPLAEPLTILFGDPVWAIFDDGANTYYPQVANGTGYVTYDLDWTVKEWFLTVDLAISEVWYGTFTGSGQLAHPDSAQLVMHYDDFRSRPFFEPIDISGYYAGIADSIWIMDYGITVPESGPLILLLLGLLPLAIRRTFFNRLH